MASSARSGRGWAEGVEEPLSLDVDFRRRREGTARRRRILLDDSNPVNDIEALEEENHKLKVALSRATEENKRYRVNKTRLEGELLRADDKIEILLFELEQTPGKRCVEARYIYVRGSATPRLGRFVIVGCCCPPSHTMSVQ